MSSLKKFFSIIINYFKAETEIVQLKEKICHHCASRGIINYQEVHKNENKK